MDVLIFKVIMISFMAVCLYGAALIIKDRDNK
jgi:hypothetical protein